MQSTTIIFFGKTKVILRKQIFTKKGICMFDVQKDLRMKIFSSSLWENE